MLTGAAIGGLEVRADDGGVRITGRFPYGVPADLAPGRSEVFAPGSLEPRSEGTFLLAHHDWAHPLASTAGGTLELRSEPDALSFEARLDPEVAGTSHGRDALALIRSGLAVGLSPGFRVMAGGERIERRSDGLLRTITRAELHEVSIVTRPAYQAMVEARAWDAPGRPVLHHSLRWR